MTNRLLLATALMVTTVGLSAQSNVVAGLNGRLTSISNFTVLGANANHIGCAAQNDMCNVGTVNIPWFAAGSSGQMNENHPKFGFLVARESAGRFVQISDRSFCKHAFVSVNGSGVCGTCQSNPFGGSMMGVNCTDAYGVGNNGDRYWLGPAHEIDPWLGTWNRIGSYFDQGFPPVGPPANTDGVRSPINITDPVTNRVTIKKADLILGATYWYQIHLIHEGESVANRGDNLMTRGVAFSGSGNNWTSNDVGGTAFGSILTRWTGAAVTSGQNNNDDGRLFVGVKVTGPNGQGRYHYEYAVHNVDYSRGAGSFRIPVCANATVENLFFRDIDDNAANDWTSSRIGNELVFTAPPGNYLEWNTIYNFAFDCTLAPQNSAVVFGQGRTGPGSATVTVNTQTPAVGPSSNGTVTSVGSGCGAPVPMLVGSGVPTIPSPNFSMQVLASPNAGMLAIYSLGSANLPIGPGCTQYLDPGSLGVHTFLVANAFGIANIPFAIPATVQPFTIFWQVATLQNGGPVMGQFGVSNALRLQATITPGGCQ